FRTRMRHARVAAGLAYPALSTAAVPQSSGAARRTGRPRTRRRCVYRCVPGPSEPCRRTPLPADPHCATGKATRSAAARAAARRRAVPVRGGIVRLRGIRAFARLLWCRFPVVYYPMFKQRFHPALCVALALVAWGHDAVSAQTGGHAPAAAAFVAPTEHQGAAALGLALRRLGTTTRVLMIAAHPDDENTAVLSALALGQGADVAYLSLTRGEGGQNLIGPELQEGLGLIRSGELLAA